MCHCPLLKNLSINLCFIIPVRFRQTQLSLPQISGYCISRFHPTDAVLACGSDEQVTIFKGVNGSVPLTNWRIEREFKGQNVKGIWSIEWNVSYSNFTEYPLVIFSAFKSCLNIKRRAMGSTNKMALFHLISCAGERDPIGCWVQRWHRHRLVLSQRRNPFSNERT